MSTGDTRTAVVDEIFVDTWPVFDADGYHKVPGLPPGTFDLTWRLDGAEIPELSHVIDEPDSNGEYRLVVGAGELSNLGYYQIEVFIPTNQQIWAVGIQVVENLVDVLRGLFVGTEQVTVAVKEPAPGSGPIGAVVVQIFDVAMSRIIQAGITNQSTGELLTTLDPGDYKTVLSKSLAAFTNPYEITVADTGGVGAAQVFPMVGETLNVGLPSSPQLCRVYGYLQSMTGQYSDEFRVRISGIGSDYSSFVAGTGAVDALSQGVAQGEKLIRASKATGIWEIDLVRGAYVRIRIESQGIDKCYRVPDVAAVNFRDLKPLEGAFNLGSAMGAATPFEAPG